MTVEEHLWFYTRLKGMDSEEADKETEQLIEDIKLPQKRNAFPKMLSGRTFIVFLKYCNI